MGAIQPHEGDQVPPPASTELIPRTSHLTPGIQSESGSRTSKKRKAEQTCDLCRKKKVKCHGGTPSASCQGHRADCSFTKVLRRKIEGEKNGQQQRKGSLDRMAERISRMEGLLRQRGFLADEQGKNAQSSTQKMEFKDADFEDIIEELGRDEMPSLCGAGVDSTTETGLTFAGSNIQPPVLEKERVMGRVEMWLEGVPPFIRNWDGGESRGREWIK